MADIDTAEAPPPTASDRAFFGHPRGLGYLLSAELFYAFAIYGLQTMMTLYLTQRLLTPGHVEHVWAFAAYEQVLRGIYGTLTPLRVASETFGLWSSLLFTLPLVGAVLADRWLGQRKAALGGFLILTLAFTTLIFEQTFLIAAALMIVGVGLLKTSFIGQIGRLYARDDDRRTRAFALYLIAVNIGSMSVPLIAGTLGEKVGWIYAMMVMALSMGFGTLCYVAGIRHTPPDTITPKKDKTAPAAPRLVKGDGRIILALLILSFFDAVALGVYNQAWNVFPVWAETHVQRHILGFQMPVTWFATLDGILTIVGAAVALRWWAMEDRRHPNPSEVRRVGVGFVMLTGAFLALAAGAVFGAGGVAPFGAAVGFFVLADFSIPFTDTVVMTVVTRDSPPAVSSTMIGLYYLFYGSGSLLTGFLGGFADRMAMGSFWLIHAAIAGVVVLALALFGGRLRQMLRPAPAV